jgi:predicted CoA-binding protein
MNVPAQVMAFLNDKRFVVAGVSRSGNQPANAVFRKLRACDLDVVPVNPRAAELEGTACYPDVASVPGVVDGVIVVTPPDAAAAVVHQAAARGIRHIWLHRSFGEGSVSEEAVKACIGHGIRPIVGGCPLMYCEPSMLPIAAFAGGSAATSGFRSDATACYE